MWNDSRKISHSCRERLSPPLSPPPRRIKLSPTLEYQQRQNTRPHISDYFFHADFTVLVQRTQPLVPIAKSSVYPARKLFSPPELFAPSRQPVRGSVIGGWWWFATDVDGDARWIGLIDSGGKPRVRGRDSLVVS